MALVSVLRPFSYGQVVTENDEQHRTINVKILEHLPSQYGVPNDDVDEITIDVPLQDAVVPKAGGGQTYEPQVKTVGCSFKDWVPANWLNRSANRISPPKVVVGQRVLLWRVGDSNQYYWEELDVDMRLKQDEHIVIALNNQNDGKTLNFDNAYIIEMSTRDSRIRIKTNRNNGEKSAFEVDINGGEGFLKMMDDCAGSKENYQGNGVLIDSVNTYLKLQNVAESNYILDKENIFMNCKGNRTSNIGGLDQVNAGNIEHNTNSHTINASSITENADSIVNSASSIAAGGGSMSITAALSVGPPAPPGGGGARSAGPSAMSAGPSAKAAGGGTVTIDGVCTIRGNTTVIGTTHFQGASTFDSKAVFQSGASFKAPVDGTLSTWSVTCNYPDKR